MVVQNGGPKILAKQGPAEEENRKIWEAASVPLIPTPLLRLTRLVCRNATNAFEVIPSSSAPVKIANFKPELKILKRAPPSMPTPRAVNTNSETPAILDRKEKERRYAEARERLFGPVSSTASSESATSVATTPTVGMSRSSSSSGLAIKNGESGSGTVTPSKERGSGARGGKKSGRGNSSGNNTPRSRSPGRGQRGSDPNRTSGIVGGITKVTENGWVYTGTGQTPRTSSPASSVPSGVDSRMGSSGIVAVSTGMMSMNLNTNTPAGYNHPTNTYPNAPNAAGVPNPWGMGPFGNGSGAIGQRPFITPGQGYPSQQYYPQNQTYLVSQPPPQFPQYSGPPSGLNSQARLYQQQQPQANNYTSYQTAGAPNPYIMPSQQHQSIQQHTMSQSHLNYQRPFAQIPTGPLPLPTSAGGVSPVPKYEPIGAPRTVYLQDPNAFTPRPPPPPPPPPGNLMPGYGNYLGTGDGNADSLNPIRAPRGPDMNMGRGFSGRGGRGGGSGIS